MTFLSFLPLSKQQAPPKPPKAPSATQIGNQAVDVDHSTNWAEKCSSSPMKQAPPKPPRTPSTMIDSKVSCSATEQSPVEPQEGATKCPDIHQKSNDNYILL